MFPAILVKIFFNNNVKLLIAIASWVSKTSIVVSQKRILITHLSRLKPVYFSNLNDLLFVAANKKCRC